ncbi:fibronectin type III domain-containing protein [Cellvibrio fibrivorans]|uniref:ABC-type phosphate transport system substrate-binding protein n=1 Tax=Cellvibrio fibrivorans TaxID=126350 RepID=A0ABU1UVZ5_9GAMM|nr:fibronectin type III domain-containing protein [Cellvibrio fibrivorans]MDR7089374.1 ABC-type phosphate transport system substrate-binding protein [Cellvibrio fibrivorans]
MLFINFGLKTPFFKRYSTTMVVVAGLALSACGGGSDSAGTTSTSYVGQSSRAVSSLMASSSMSSTTSSLVSSVISEISSSAASSEKNVVEIHWVTPNQRVNGDYMDIGEIGGYELRYKREIDNYFTSVIINDKDAATYYLDDLRGEYEFKIAVFDVDGLYSEFVEVERM